MAARRFLSLWFPRLAAERALRLRPGLAAGPFAVVGEAQGALVLASLSAAAEAAGLRRGMALGDARAIRPDLATLPADPFGERAFLGALARWAGRFSPWVAAEPPESLCLDVTGCAHLFGGEAGLAAAAATAAADLGLTLRLGLADTRGAAWALARYAGTGARPRHAGDAIDQEARATRSRAERRGAGRGKDGGLDGAPPAAGRGRGMGAGRIAPVGAALVHLAPLPVAALRLGETEAEAARALGLRRIGDLVGLPRAELARRLGPEALRRLDQALGRAPEPLAPEPPEPVFAVRLTLPEPIGHETEALVGLDRLLAPLCARLRAAGRGARVLRLTLLRVDGGAQVAEARLARPADRPEQVRPLLALRLGGRAGGLGAGLEAGYGVEALQLEALVTEPLAPRQDKAPLAGPTADPEALADLIGRLDARLGTAAVTRLHPADSHVPERSATPMPAVFAPPAGAWPGVAAGFAPGAGGGQRPAVIFPPEPVRPRDAAVPPERFVWRRRPRRRSLAIGPERIMPEWWLDDPAWRSGGRDYWQVETMEGERLWLFETRGAAAGWFAQGVFA